MQKLARCFLLLLVLFSTISSLFAQEALVQEAHYFQGQVIRKVSIGHNATWVIKGQDSTGVGKVDLLGMEFDYTATVNTQFPLTGIVGKYGDSAMIATRGNYLLMYDKGKITRLDEAAGVKHSRINDIMGSVKHSRIATDSGAQDSYNNLRFAPAKYTGLLGPMLRISQEGGIPVYAYAGEGRYCNSNYANKTIDVIIERGSSNNVIDFKFADMPVLNAIAAYDQYENWEQKIFIGGSRGMLVKLRDCQFEATPLLQDTTVYAIKKWGNRMLIGTEKGLYYCEGYFPTKTYPLSIGGDYKVFDITTDEENKLVWLATNQGLIKLTENADQQPVIHTNSNIAWAKRIGGAFADQLNEMVTDASGNIYITGYFSGIVGFGDTTLISSNYQDHYLAKFAPDGKLRWVRSAAYPDDHGYLIKAGSNNLVIDKHGNVYIYMSYSSADPGPLSFAPDFGYGIKPAVPTQHHSFIVKYNAAGIPLWANNYDNGHFLANNTQMQVDSNGNLYIATAYNDPTQSNQTVWKIEKFNTDFSPLWEKSYPGKFNNFKLKPGGDFYLTGSFDYKLTVGPLEFTSSGNNDLVLVYFDKAGNAQWGTNFGGYSPNSHIRRISDVGFDQMGNTFIAGDFDYQLSINNSTATTGGIFHAKINPLGKFEWARIGETGDFKAVRNIEVDSMGFSFISGMFSNTLTFDKHSLSTSDPHEPFLLKFDPNGNLSWYFTIPGGSIKNYSNKAISRGAKSTILFAGVLTKNLLLNDKLLQAKGPSDIFLASIRDPDGPHNFNLVSGKTFFDKNKNGQFDAGDEPIQDQIIKAEPGPFYSKSDAQGNYLLYLKNGNYSIDQIIPNYRGKVITRNDPLQAYPLQLNATKTDTAGFDFANDVKVAPILSLDITSTNFRRCFTNTTLVEYCNEGYADAQNVAVKLEYPEWVVPIASSFPWTKNGNTYTFSIGTMAAQSCKTISLKDSVICGNEEIRALTQCIKATITPRNTVLNTSPSWDRSDIALAAECRDNGFVRVSLQNTGTGAMADSAAFNVFMDEARVYNGKYKLGAGESLSLNLLANGKPLHIEASLTPHHPEKKKVSISIQGCNTAEGAVVIKGFEEQFSENDESETFESICLPIIDSYDPNDKQVYPIGVSATHNVAEDELLEYTIRFQNTGTAEAVNIVVVDPLSEYLDIATLKVGLSSHPVSWEFGQNEQPTLIWRFKNIMLPDSTTNELASHGFVKFKIRAKADAPKGTIISNKAQIYFDYNSPIITNVVLNTLGLPDITAANKILLQNCNSSLSTTAGQDLILNACGSTSYLLSRQNPGAGRGIWRVSKGTATLANAYKHETLASNLAFGENEFVWEVIYCDQKVSSKVTVIREAPLQKPAVAATLNLCQGEPMPLTATGEGIEWFYDAALTALAATGNSFAPAADNSQDLWVVSRKESCTSEAALVSVIVHEKPLPPLAQAQEACVEITKPVLTAQGSNLRWYADEARQQLLGEGANFTPAIKSSQTYWVSQSSEHCESEVVAVNFTAKLFDATKAVMPNVVIPAGKKDNQQYWVREFETQECLGQFHSVKIFNRWGVQVFESKQKNFSWEAEKHPAGVYYYQMQYQLQSFWGHIQLLR